MNQPKSYFQRLAALHRSGLRRLRLLLSMLSSGYLFFYVTVTPDGRMFRFLAGWAVLILAAYVFEDLRRYLYLSGRRSAHSISGKLLS